MKWNVKSAEIKCESCSDIKYEIECEINEKECKSCNDPVKWNVKSNKSNVKDAVKSNVKSCEISGEIKCGIECEIK